MLNIDRDLGRFRDIVRGRVRKDLRKYMSSGELVGKQGNKAVSIPLHQIGIPRLRYGKNDGGVGQGDGQGEGPGQGQQAGDAAGEHALEVEISVQELAEILGEELELPRIEPKGAASTSTKRHKYTGIRRVGPESLRHMKRTYKQALKRSIAGGTFDPRKPMVVPRKDDKRYRAYNVETEPRSAAVIVYMMDVSGSMGKEQKEIVRSEAFWIDAWLKHNYDEIDTRFIIHDAAAREVDRDTFFRTRESGGTLISSAYKLALEILEADYSASDWNIYPFHFSDGDNWSTSDTGTCMSLLKDRLVPMSNQFSYAQVDSQYGSGQFIKDLNQHFAGEERVVLSRIADRDGIMDSIRELLAKGN
ncbi:MAG: uncharacterized sporulation protein YeaH/YhbH (DUF444 family) [Myxococcota bacterium]|jgi:uncharacterized sporulation protein YeaH/YhbH (DUF444 family)